MSENLESRVEELMTAVLSQDRSNPGLLMRVTQLEWFVKALIGLAGMGILWKALDVVGSIVANQVIPKP